MSTIHKRACKRYEQAVEALDKLGCTSDVDRYILRVLRAVPEVRKAMLALRFRDVTGAAESGPCWCRRGPVNEAGTWIHEIECHDARAALALLPAESEDSDANRV